MFKFNTIKVKFNFFQKIFLGKEGKERLRQEKFDKLMNSYENRLVRYEKNTKLRTAAIEKYKKDQQENKKCQQSKIKNV